MALQTLPAVRYCAMCRRPLDDGHPDDDTMHDQCHRDWMAALRKQSRASVSAGRACARCGCSMWPQARSCLVCAHIVGDELPDKEWI